MNFSTIQADRKAFSENCCLIHTTNNIKQKRLPLQKFHRKCGPFVQHCSLICQQGTVAEQRRNWILFALGDISWHAETEWNKRVPLAPEQDLSWHCSLILVFEAEAPSHCGMETHCDCMSISFNIQWIFMLSSPKPNLCSVFFYSLSPSPSLFFFFLSLSSLSFLRWHFHLLCCLTFNVLPELWLTSFAGLYQYLWWNLLYSHIILWCINKSNRCTTCNSSKVRNSVAELKLLKLLQIALSKAN